MSISMEMEQRYIDAVAKGSASTVSVRTSSSQEAPFGRCFRRGAGSGIVLDAEGHILTNAHVVHRADRIMVIAGDGTVHQGEVLGEDATTDVAVVKVEGAQLTPAALGDSDRLKVGQPILCIGNPLGLSGGPTVSSGVISSLCRSLIMGRGEGLPVLQTDAPVNPGSSGGPLINLAGEVMAMTAAQIPFAEGMGFAIPINIAQGIARQIIEKGRVERAWLGITAHHVDMRMAYHFRLPDTCGVFVTDVTRGSPAEESGIRMGDVILKMGSKMLGGVPDLLAGLSGMKAGEKIDVEVRRNGRTEKRQVTLGVRPF
jgi:serine protease Do